MPDFDAGMGNGAFIRISVTLGEQDQALNRSRVYYLFAFYKGAAASFSTTPVPYSFNIDGMPFSGDFTYDFRTSSQIVLEASSLWVTHNAQGLRDVSFTGTVGVTENAGGPATASGTLTLEPILRAPGAPALGAITDITNTTAKAHFAAPSSPGGSPITEYEVSVSYPNSSDVGFSVSVAPNVFSQTLTGIFNSARTAVRVRAKNALGTGPWSNTRTFFTSGNNACRIGKYLSPFNDALWFDADFPATGQLAGIPTYTIRRVVTGPNIAPTALEWTASSWGSLTDPYKLLPGQSATYQITRAAVSGPAVPWSHSITFDYVDLYQKLPVPALWPIGSRGLLDYTVYEESWTGTANNSISQLKGRKPRGWRTFSSGANGLATGVVTQIPKKFMPVGSTGLFDVLAIFSSVQTVAGIRLGTEVPSGGSGMAEVFATLPSVKPVNYFGSMVVMTDNVTRLALEIEWYGDDLELISRSRGDEVVMQPGVPVTLMTTGAAPVGATTAALVTVDIAGTSWHAGSLRVMGSAQLSASVRYPYFDGATPDSTVYSYEWMGSANQSPSQRISLEATGANTALQDPDEDPLVQPPRPPQIEEGTLLNDIFWRRYVAAIPAAEVHEWVASVPTLILHANQAIEREVRIRYWANPYDLPASAWAGDFTQLQSEQVISYIPANSTFTVDGVSERSFVVMDGGDTTELDANHLLYGQGGGPATWPVLACGVSYIVTLDVPTDSLIGNLELSLELTDRML